MGSTSSLKNLQASLVVSIALLSACGNDSEEGATATSTTTVATTTTSAAGQPEAPAPFELSSTAFDAGAAIPDRHTCNADDVSPALAWTDPPDGVVAFALVMDDPDAVPVAGFVWDHWVVWGMSGDAREIPEAVSPDQAPAGGTQGINSFGFAGYGGPCPPEGQTHQYVFKIYALDDEVEPAEPTKEALLTAIEGRVVAEATLTGSFGR